MSSMFTRMFQGNPDVSNWDTSQVINMSGLFAHMGYAKPDTSRWDTSKVKYMGAIFAGHQHTPDVSNWDTSQAIGMSAMFYASQANPDVSRWDTSQVIDMSSMFRSTPNANPDISSWDLGRIKKMRNVLDGLTGLSSENYSTFLKVVAETAPRITSSEEKVIGWFTPIKTQYNSEAASFRATLIDEGWVINDGGPKVTTLSIGKDL